MFCWRRDEDGDEGSERRPVEGYSSPAFLAASVSTSLSAPVRMPTVVVSGYTLPPLGRPRGRKPGAITAVPRATVGGPAGGAGGGASGPLTRDPAGIAAAPREGASYHAMSSGDDAFALGGSEGVFGEAVDIASGSDNSNSSAASSSATQAVITEIGSSMQTDGDDEVSSISASVSLDRTVLSSGSHVASSSVSLSSSSVTASTFLTPIVLDAEALTAGSGGGESVDAVGCKSPHSPRDSPTAVAMLASPAATPATSPVSSPVTSPAGGGAYQLPATAAGASSPLAEAATAVAAVPGYTGQIVDSDQQMQRQQQKQQQQQQQQQHQQQVEPADRLPPGWSKCFSQRYSRHYWFHADTGKSVWEPPT